jgi:oligopeptide transport system substrate-binding protein
MLSLATTPPRWRTPPRTRRVATFHALLLTLACALLLAGCGGEERATTAQRDDGGLKVYRHSMDQAPSSIDPVQSSNIYANTVTLNAYDTLFAFKYLKRPYELKPNLAAAMPEISEDGLTYTIRIREGVHFIDDPAFEGGIGREVTAADFVYSLKRHFDPAMRGQGAWLWQGRIVDMDDWKARGSNYDEEVAGLRALDRYTIRIQLTKPYPQLMYTLAQGYSAVVPCEAVAYYGKGFGSKPVGSGPFRVLSYDSSRIVFEPNPKYRREPVDIWAEGYDPATQGYTGVEAIHGRVPPFVDRLEIHFIGESAARWNSFTKGNEVQFATVPNEQVDNILASKDPIRLRPAYDERYFMKQYVESGFVFAAFNLDFPEIGYNDDPERERRNKLLRCAMIRGFNWDKRNESFYYGLGYVFPGIIPPATPEFDPDMSRESVTLDIDGAKRLLAEGGWNADNLPEIVYGTTGSVVSRQFFEQFRGQMKKIGYPPEKIILKQFATFGDISRAWKNSTLPFVTKGWGLDYPDAENTLQLFYGPNGSPGSNDANYVNPEYDRLYEQTAVMLPSPERTALYQRMNQMVIDDCVAITGLSRTRIMLWHRDVIAVPDREIVGGFFLKYVDLRDPAEPGIPATSTTVTE